MLLLCPEATQRRAAGDPIVEKLRPATAPEAQLADYGGARSAYNFPDFAGDFSATNLLIASYGANDWIYNARADIQGRARADHWGGYANVPLPTETPIFLDSMWRGGGPDHRSAPKDWAPDSNSQWSDADAESAHFAIARHRRGVNIAFFDQSVRATTSPQKIWTFKWHRAYQRHGLERTRTFPAWMR